MQVIFWLNVQINQGLDTKLDRLGFDDDFVTKDDEAETKKASEKKHSKKVLQELKSVLVVKQQEMEAREARAIARQARVNSVDGDNLQLTKEDIDNHNEKTGGDEEEEGENNEYLEVPKSLVQTNILGLSQETDSDAESIDSDTNTVRSIDNR